MIEGAVITLVSLAIGAVLGRRTKKPSHGQENVARCACEHLRSMHVDGTGRCEMLVYVKGTSSKSSHHAKCKCQHYDGPEPIPGFYAPEISG